MIWVVGAKAMLNFACAGGFIYTGRWPFAVLFAGCALADIGSMLVLRGVQ
jgi:hypothetical protein